MPLRRYSTKPNRAMRLPRGKDGAPIINTATGETLQSASTLGFVRMLASQRCEKGWLIRDCLANHTPRHLNHYCWPCRARQLLTDLNQPLPPITTPQQ